MGNTIINLSLNVYLSTLFLILFSKGIFFYEYKRKQPQRRADTESTEEGVSGTAP